MTWHLNGLRTRVALLVLAVTACLYSVLGTIGVLRVADSGRDAIRSRVDEVLDQLESGVRAGSTTVRIVTADGVEATASIPDRVPTVPAGDVTVRRTLELDVGRVVLVGHASQARLADSIRSLWRGVWIAVPLASMLTAIAAGYATARVMRPVDEIVALAESIGAHDTGARVPMPDTGDEIEQLARTVNAMLDRLAAGRLAQQRFTSDAAHELRTPLMALQGELELAQDEPQRLAPDLHERMQVLVVRLAARVDDLLLLSTLDEGRPMASGSVDLTSMVRAEAASLPRGCPIDIVGDAAVVVGDDALLRRATVNLLANAVRHARTTVQVTIAADCRSVLVHVDDDGPGIPEAERAHVLDRFARVDRARGSSGGAGLGLSITAAVVARHGGAIEVATSPSGGARITVRLPAAATPTMPAT